MFLNREDFGNSPPWLRRYWHSPVDALQVNPAQQVLERVLQLAPFLRQQAGSAAQSGSEQSVSYSNNTYVQMLSLLRRFIDEVDRFERFLLVVLTSPSFFE